MKILDGKIVSDSVKEILKKKVDSLLGHNSRVPHLAAILIGNNGASETYVASKIRNCAEIGFKSTLVRFADHVPEDELIAAIEKLNKDAGVDGILLQLPLPKHIDEEKIISFIDPEKDVDGFHPLNTGKLIQGLPGYIPATPYGILLMLEHYGIETAGKHAVVIGRSNIVGRPISVLLSQNNARANCTVTLCHSRTNNLIDFSRQADILVVALGKANFLTAGMVKENAVVIDVGITRVADPSKKSGYALKGDVDFDQVAPKCSYITPVPGGVGPMTIAALLKNTWNAFETRQLNRLS